MPCTSTTLIASDAEHGDVDEQVAEIFVGHDGAVDGDDEDLVFEARHVFEDAAEVGGLDRRRRGRAGLLALLLIAVQRFSAKRGRSSMRGFGTVGEACAVGPPLAGVPLQCECDTERSHARCDLTRTASPALAASTDGKLAAPIRRTR